MRETQPSRGIYIDDNRHYYDGHKCSILYYNHSNNHTVYTRQNRSINMVESYSIMDRVMGNGFTLINRRVLSNGNS